MTTTFAVALIWNLWLRKLMSNGDTYVGPTLIALLLVFQSATPSEADNGWQAGVAKIRITPDQPMLASGKKQRPQPATETLHELWAKALVLSDPAGARAVLVTLDLVGIDRSLSEAVCDTLAEMYQFERREVALCTSHTHNGPIVGSNLALMFALDDMQQSRTDHYATSLHGKIVSVVGEAIGCLGPCRLAWGTGRAGFAINRVTLTRAELESLLQGGNARGPVDHDVPVLSVTDHDGRHKAIVFGYACHPIWLRHFSVWSGDYPSVAQATIEDNHPGAVAMFCAGCGGDQNPLSTGGRLQRAEREQALLPERFRQTAIEEVEDIGGQLARAVETVLAGCMTPIVDELRTSYREVDLPFGTLPSVDQLRQDAASASEYRARWAQSLLQQIDSGQSLARTYPYPVQVWQLGSDLSFIALGGETTVEYSLQLKQKLGPQNTWVTGYANDVMAYIPSQRVLMRGGYEAGGAMIYYGLPAPWAPQLEARIVASVLRQAEQLTREENRKP